MEKILFTSLVECFELHKDHINGQVDEDHVNEALKRFFLSLNEYVDLRIKSAFEERRKQIGKDKVLLAEELNYTVSDTLKSISSIRALASAPPPPENTKEIEMFVREYNSWYDQERAKEFEIK